MPYKLTLVNRPNSYTVPISALKLSNQEWPSGSLSIGGFSIAARYQNPQGGINLATVANFVHSLEDARDASFERWSFDGYTKRGETLRSDTQEMYKTKWWACHEKGRRLDFYLEESPSTCNFIAICLRAARTLPHLRSLLPDLPEAFGIRDVEMAGQRIGLSVPEVLELLDSSEGSYASAAKRRNSRRRTHGAARHQERGEACTHRPVPQRRL